MKDDIILRTIKNNILNLDRSLTDAPYHGVNRDTINGIEFAIDKIIKGTGITVEGLIEEDI